MYFDEGRDSRPETEEEEPKATWKDVLAMTIAAYELLLLPMLLVFSGIGLVVLLFYLLFS